MTTFQQTDEFNKWLRHLKDRRAQAVIFNRLDRASKGNFGDTKSTGGSVFEMRIDFGPGYRIYYARRGENIYLLLFGGDKATQATDIKRAKAILKSLIEE
jgi:putative addiction module killer protein